MERGGSAWKVSMTDLEADALLSVAQAAGVLGVHPNTIRAWTDAGRLTAYRINSRGDRRFRRSDVVRLLVEDGVPGDELPLATAGEIESPGFFGRVATGLAATPSVEGAGRTLVEAVRTELGAERAAVYVAEPDGLRLVAHGGLSEPPPARLTASPTEPLLPDGDSEDVRLPLVTGRGPAGLLLLDRDTADGLSPAFRRAVVATAATAIATARVLNRARRDARRSRALRSVTKELTGNLDLRAVLAEIVELTRTLFDADKAGLWLLDGTDRPFRLATHQGLGDAFRAQVAALHRDADTIGNRALRERRAKTMSRADEEQDIGLLRQTYAAEGIRTVCLVPLVGRDEPLGLLGLYHHTDRTWPGEEVALVQAFADQAAVAIHNARLYEAAGAQAARMRSIQDLSARLNRLTDVRAIGEAIVTEARTLAEYHDIRIYRVDRERGVCDPIAFTREMLSADAEDAETLLRVEIGEGFTGWVAEHGEPLLVNDALDDPRGKTIDGTDDVPESMLVVPMLYEGEALGVIVLSQLGFNRFTEDDLATMQIFGGYAAQAMANAASYERLVAQSVELARRADSQRRLLEINERLLTLDQAGVLETIADGLRDVVAYDNLSIYRADHTSRTMAPVLTRERHAEEVGRYVISFGQGLMGWAVEHKQPILANDALSDPRALQIPGTPEDPEAVVVVPLVAEGQVLGALNVSRVGGPEVYFSESDFELVQLFAAQASIALSNADAHQALSQRAETDALTGLGNHGAFQRDLSRLVDGADAGLRDADRRLAVLMMDLDRFKAYNDRLGHPAGDALLHHVATAIYGAARSDDLVYRYGGDEFAVILPGASIPAAARVAQRIHRAVGRLTAGDPTPVTITVGVAGFPADASDRASLVQAADTALFFGKRSGENQVVRHDRLPTDLEERREAIEELTRTAIRDVEPERGLGVLGERPGRPRPHVPADDVVSVALAVATATSGAARRSNGERVGRLAARVAAHLGLPPDAQREVELAGRLHDLDDAGVAGLGRIPALRRVARLLAEERRLSGTGAAHARGTGHGRGRSAAHIIGAARAYDALASGPHGDRMPRAEALERLRRGPSPWRPEVLDALARAVHQPRDTGRRRRRSDDAAREGRGAA
jgi:diguanylate cyclase (GGDEF)-like protein/excisionase family DNA binding protein